MEQGGKKRAHKLSNLRREMCVCICKQTVVLSVTAAACTHTVCHRHPSQLSSVQEELQVCKHLSICNLFCAPCIVT